MSQSVIEETQAPPVGAEETHKGPTCYKKEIGPENFIFIVLFVAFFALFAAKMGLGNTINTMINTAFVLLTDTVLYLTALCVIMGAISALFSEFGLVSLMNRMLNPFMRPVYGLPGAASVGVVTTFLSDNPAILSLAQDRYFKSLFKAYQFPALTNLGTSFGMGFIVCTYMISLSPGKGVNYTGAALTGLLGAVVGSIVSTRIMLAFTAKIYGREQPMIDGGTLSLGGQAGASRPGRRHRHPLHVCPAGRRHGRRENGREHHTGRAGYLHGGDDAHQRPDRERPVYRRGLRGHRTSAQAGG